MKSVPEYDEFDGTSAEVDSSSDVSTEPAEVAPAVKSTTAVATLDDLEDGDPAVALRQALRFAPGDWYVVHSYAGYENKVKTNLETRITKPRHGGLHLPGLRCRPGRGRGQERQAPERCRTRSSLLHPGPE